MFNSLICGTSNLREEHDDETLIATCSKSTPKTKHTKSKDSKNPYSEQGLEKFYALLEELENKKQKIYTQKGGSQDISSVRFVYYSSSDDWKPIVVKAKKERTRFSQKQGKKKTEIIHVTQNSENKDKHGLISDDPVVEESARSRSNFEIGNLKEPCCWYMPLFMMIVLILLILVTYGKTFAILCSSIGWYLIPTIKASGLSSNSGDSKLSGKNVVNKHSISP